MQDETHRSGVAPGSSVGGEGEAEAVAVAGLLRDGEAGAAVAPGAHQAGDGDERAAVRPHAVELHAHAGPLAEVGAGGGVLVERVAVGRALEDQGLAPRVS